MRAQQPIARNKQHAAHHLGIIITNKNIMHIYFQKRRWATT
jgi:hypothetical protein